MTVLKRTTSRYRQLFPAIVAILGLAVSIISMFSIRQSERTRLETEFHRRSARISDSLEREIDGYVDTVLALQNFAYLGIEAGVDMNPNGPMDLLGDPESWKWARLLFRQRFEDAQRAHPALVSQGWITYATPEMLPITLAFARNLVSEAFRITEFDEEGRLVEAAKHEDYFPMFFYEPLGDGTFLGFNHGTIALTRRALEQARDTGTIKSTEPLTWFEDLFGAPGFYIYAPVYNHREIPATTKARRKKLYTFVFSLVNVDALINERQNIHGEEGVEYRLSTEVTGGFGQTGVQVGDFTLFETGGYRDCVANPRFREMSLTHALNLGDQDWTLELYPDTGIVASFITPLPYFVLVIGLIITGGLTIFLRDTAGHAARVERLIEERTRELGLSNKELREEIANRQKAELEKQELERRLIQNQKMEAIGTLAGGVAHDFNNLLTGILGYAELLRDEKLPAAKIPKAAAVILGASERAKELTSQLLGFARRGKHQNVRLDVHAIIREVITLLRRTLNKNVKIVEDFEAGTATTRGDPDQIQQVVLNLAVNAGDAMPHGGSLRCETRFVNVDEEDCRQQEDAIPGRYIAISIEDTGTGIPEDIHDRIFEPFFTTKEQGKGTGMGLAMVYGIVKNHGGFISLESRVGGGSRFTVYLPVALEIESSPSLENVKDDAARGKGTILVIDDEEIVTDVASSMLTELGYDVTAFCDAREAVRYLEQHPDAIDLAIIDMIMPDMDGRECFHALQAIRPGLITILSTGFSRDDVAQDLLREEEMVGFVQKPYRLHQIAEVVSTAFKTLKASL